MPGNETEWSSNQINLASYEQKRRRKVGSHNLQSATPLTPATIGFFGIVEKS